VLAATFAFRPRDTHARFIRNHLEKSDLIRGHASCIIMSETLHGEPRQLIGITTNGKNDENRFLLPREYVDVVRRAGGVPVLLPPGEAALNGLVESLDGLILSGGGDLDPVHYGGRQHETIYNVDAERDASDLALAKLVVDSGLPTLGICRGMQIINVALGGTLHEHLPEAVGETILHRAPPRDATQHAVTLRSNSRLASFLPAVEFVAASWHHQAIRDVAPPLEIAADAADGTIEAIEMRGHPWLIGVQWHPELTAADDPIQQQLFNAFVEATKRLRGTHPKSTHAFTTGFQKPSGGNPREENTRRD